MDSKGEVSKGRQYVSDARRIWREQISGSNFLATVIAVAVLALLTWLAQVQSLGGKPLEAEPSFTSFQWWLHPVERNRFLRPDTQDATIEQYDLNAVAFSLKGESGWAVGKSGAILHTADGGRSWSLQVWSSPPAGDSGARKQKQSRLHLISPASAGDGPAPVPGGTQIAQQQREPSFGLPADARTDRNANPPGKRVQSSGEGLQSQTAPQPQQQKLTAIPSAVVVKAGGDQTYSIAIRGGRGPYHMQVGGALPKGLDIGIDNSGEIRIKGASQVTSAGDFSILVTDLLDDSVQIHVEVVLPPGIKTEASKPAPIPPQPVQRTDTKADVPVPKGDKDAKKDAAKKDAVTKQEQQPVPPPFEPLPAGVYPDLNDVYFLADGMRGWIVGSHGTVLRTQDGGKTWELRPPVSSLDLHAVAFDAKGERGWAVGSDSHIIASENGGETWKVQPSRTKATLKAIVVYDGKARLAVGEKGTILQTDDGGTWHERTSATKSALHAVSLDASAKRALAVGEGGVVLTTADGGVTWQRDKFSAGNTLWAVFLNASGQKGWMVGDSGTVVTTQDGGVRWEQRSIEPGTRLRSVAFADDGRRGVIVGHGFTIATTHDGGASWIRVTHRQYPAPWFYLASLLVLGLTVTLFYRAYVRGIEDASIKSITDKGESDEPIDSIEKDRLGFAPLVEGLVGYLRNRATVPPLTIAVSAPWGGGKSSVMKMLRTEMQSVGVRCVWFNAWHHQQEDLMVAALIESIRSQALPFWATREGIVFRARLLWRRMCSHPFVATVSISALLLALSHLLGELFSWAERKPSNQRGWVEYAADAISGIWDSPDQGVIADRHLFEKLLDGKLTEFAGGVVSAVFGAPETFLYSVELAVLAAAIVVLFLFGIRSFPGSPAVLLATVASQFKIGEAQAQTSYRQRFKTHFSDVCESLRPRTMLIFIDDLDRCAPDKTAEMLEAINYLVNSGPCFVVVGMARDIVEAQLAIYFHRVADAHTASDAADGASLPASSSQADPAPALVADRSRTEYVRNYLRKLVNLEVHIPQMTRDKLFSLLDLPPEPGAPDSKTPVPEADSKAAAGGWRAAAVTLERAFHGRSRAVTVCALLLLAVVAVMLVEPGINRWDQTRIEKIRIGRKAAEERLNSIREAERRAAVALDFARGKEKRIASELFDKYRIAVAGLEFRLPVDPPSSARKYGSERCALAQSARPKKPPPPVALEDSDELFCWREGAAASRAVEAQLTQIRGALAAALAARSRDSFDRVAQELTKAQKAAESAEQLAGVMRTLPVSLPPAAVASTGNSTAGTPATERANRAPRTTERAMAAYVFLFVLLAWAAVYAMTRRESYALSDQPHFQSALRIWSPLLETQKMFAVPRETKRFQNRARFYAMRLRNPIGHPGLLSRVGAWLDGEKDKKPDGKTSIQEEIIVALTAIHQVCPALLTSKSSPLFESGNNPRLDAALVEEVRKHIVAHNERAAKSEGTPFARFPDDRRNLLAFIAIVEEFKDEPEPGPPLKAVA